MNASQQRYYNEIRAVVESKGGKMISDRYEKMINKMIFQCQNGHTWDTEARSILKGMWCRYCHGNTKEQGEENFYRRVAEKEGIVLGEYKGNHNRVLVQCKLGHQWNILPHNLTTGKWCDVCNYKHLGGGSERFMKIIDERKGKVLGQYVNTRTRIDVQCYKGHIWDPKPFYVVIGGWCPFCTGSSGENAVATFLNEKGIEYKSQRSIPGLPRKRYDFLIQYKGQNIIIEYDGEMHFKYVPYYHITEEYFKYRQAVDRVKTLTALSNGYRMIRIDYSQSLNIKHHIDVGLESKDSLYLSTPKLYQGWLAGAKVPPEEVQAVNEGRSRPDYHEDVPAEETTNRLSTGLSLLIIR